MTKWTTLAAVAVMLAVLPTAASAAPSLGDLVGIQAQGELGSQDLKLIRDYSAEMLARLKKADNYADIEKARKALVSGYGAKGDSTNYQMAYAKSLAQQAVVWLKDDMPLKSVKQANLAMVPSEARIDQINIQPLLEALIRLDNPAARYWTAKAYRQAAKALLAQGGQTASRLLADLEAAGRRETSGAAFAQILLSLRPIGDLAPAQNLALQAIFDKLWLARLDRLEAGDPEFILAYGRVLSQVSAVFPEPAQAIQLIADAAEAATIGLTKKPPDPSALAELVRELERQLRTLSGQQALTPLAEALTGTAIDEAKALKARIDFNAKWKPVLAGMKVNVRYIPSAPATSTKPATGSAPAATTTAGKGG